ncbi:MAG TPA: peptide ABC transporter ATP-binding protein, partial [Gammaproteobacteria bacterium]|nr:peptide ABC transporter ATP-binding protein [Gammaproteobacteria bacterium]
ATIMVVSHNLGLIAELCDQVVVMYAGEVVEYGSVSNLFYEPAHPYTQALLNCDPARTQTKTRYLPVIPGDVPDLHVLPTGCIFAARCSQVMEQCKTTSPAKVQLDESQHVASCHLLDPGLQASG